MLCGMSEPRTWSATPGRIIDLYLYRREYDESIHGKKPEKGDDDDGE